MKPVVYIDGKEGTTGLQIFERLGSRDDIDLILIDEDKRKDTAERKKFINAADIVFLCLPDAAAREAVALCENDTTRFIDASTAHRTDPAWDYGFAELSEAHRAAIMKSKRVANPGCHASGFISSVYPLVKLGIVPADYPLTCSSLTGYSGGGKKLIAEYEDPNRDPRHDSHRIYGTTLKHKHLPEMVMMTGISRAPAFSPIVGDFYSGMVMTVPLHTGMLHGSPGPEEIRQVYRERYGGEKLIRVMDKDPEDGFIHSNVMAGSDEFQIFVTGNEERVLLLSRFDNLGKGASGQAVQNMNIMLGIEETKGV